MNISTRSWDSPGVINPGDGAWNEGFLSSESKQFDVAVSDLQTAYEEAKKALEGGGASNPQVLADFQAKLAEYTLFRSAQSKMVEALASMDKATVNRLA